MDQNANTQKFALQNADSQMWVSFGTTKIKILIKKNERDKKGPQCRREESGARENQRCC